MTLTSRLTEAANYCPRNGCTDNGHADVAHGAAALLREAAEALRKADEMAKAAGQVEKRISQVYVENLHREVLIEEQWPLLDEANVLRAALREYKGEKK